jgi:hypothetical protein
MPDLGQSEASLMSQPETSFPMPGGHRALCAYLKVAEAHGWFDALDRRIIWRQFCRVMWAVLDA